jgi:CRP/FNR family transcriptional regulator
MLTEIPHCISCVLSECFILNCCSEKWKQKIDGLKVVEIYQEKQNIFSENNLFYGVHIIFQGQAKISCFGKDRKQYTIHYATKGDLLGFKRHADETYNVSSTTLKDTVVCFINKEIFSDAINANPKLVWALMQNYAKELAHAELRQKYLAHFSATVRVAEALLLIKKHFGIAEGDSTLLDVKLNRRDIANIAGTNYEVAVRILVDFRKEKIIDYYQNKKNKILLLNSDKLFQMILDNWGEKDVNINKNKCCAHLL